MIGYSISRAGSEDVLRVYSSDYFDACVTDPPYGQGMEHWDKDVPPAEMWAEILRTLKPGAYCLSFCSTQLYHRMATKMEDAGFIIQDQIMWMITTKMAKKNKLKPAYEPIAVAQKPISEKSMKANYEKWGTGYINTDNARVPWEGEPPKGWVKDGHKRRHFGKDGNTKGNRETNGTVDANPNGRYPSNIIGYFDNPDHQKYFYAPRVSSKERGEYNDHPTPKPISLMRYLVRIYSPSKGLVLDPFLGSGSTGIGAIQEGRSFVGIEKESCYAEIAERRIQDHCGHLGFDKLFAYES